MVDFTYLFYHCVGRKQEMIKLAEQRATLPGSAAAGSRTRHLLICMSRALTTALTSHKNRRY